MRLGKGLAILALIFGIVGLTLSVVYTPGPFGNGKMPGRGVEPPSGSLSPQAGYSRPVSPVTAPARRRTSAAAVSTHKASVAPVPVAPAGPPPMTYGYVPSFGPAAGRP